MTSRSNEYQNPFIWRGLVCLLLDRDTAVDDVETLDYEELRAEILALKERQKECA